MKRSIARSVPPEYFDAKYVEKLDYWDFETSAYGRPNTPIPSSRCPRDNTETLLKLVARLVS